MNRVTAVLIRDTRHELTFGVLEADATAKIDSGDKLIAAVRQGVTNWVNKTQEGMAAWHDSSADLNVGDLVGFTDADGKVAESGLPPHLDEQGVYNLTVKVQTYPAPSKVYAFDTVLGG